MGAANKLKELFERNQPNDSGNGNAKQQDRIYTEQQAQKDKAMVEHMRKALQEKLKKDPKLNKKAAMIIEQMMEKEPPSK
ncbi:MAG: hypothetical protein NXH75_03790 [Halobacteriovoraceae bacterium]|jgi:hypothetical protein|nr:hypothetical protein [Halobacteriovoraceae bacterium]